MNKQQIPAEYYNEIVKEKTSRLYRVKTNPARQKARIDAIVSNGKDHEVMPNGMQVSLDKIKGFYDNALMELSEVDKLTKGLEAFKAQYEPNENMYGDLKSAYKDIDSFRKSNEHYNDSERNFDLLHNTSHKYFLSNKQMDDLMEYMMDLDLIALT